jgi:hypothetical protein
MFEFRNDDSLSQFTRGGLFLTLCDWGANILVLRWSPLGCSAAQRCLLQGRLGEDGQ